MKSIKLVDSLYGEFQIDDPVIIELISSPSIQRLKKICQFGIPDEFYHLKNFYRFEHSVGVMLLLRHLGASLEEQVAGLLHDVSHRAFSHVYDWIIEDHSIPGVKHESAQDDFHTDFILNSEIPSILEKHQFNVGRITNYHNFSLLEQSTPDLCADRVDYSLEEISGKKASKIFKGLTVHKGKIVCRDLTTAQLFGKAFLKLQEKHWGGFEAVNRYALFAKALKIALSRGDINSEDFLIDDAYVIKKLKSSKDSTVRAILRTLRAPLPKPKEGKRHYKKFRYIDPSFTEGNKTYLLSQTDPEFSSLLEKARERNTKGVLVAIEDDL